MTLNVAESRMILIKQHHPAVLLNLVSLEDRTMMKRLFCLTLVAVMLLSVFAFSFSAAEVNDKAVTGADVIKFDNSITKWTGPVQFFVYDPEGEELIPWGSKKLNGTDEGNNIWSKDLSEYGLESGKQYCVIFCDASTGAQTYDLVFDASCFGKTDSDS